MSDFFKLFLELGASGLMIYIAFQFNQKHLKDISNEELDRRNQHRHVEYLAESKLLREDIYNLIVVLSGKFIEPRNFINTMNLKFREMQLVFYSKVDKTNIDKNYNDIMDEIGILIEEKEKELEDYVKHNGSQKLSKSVSDNLKPVFLEYGESVRKLFHYYSENHKAGETKRAISNLTASYIQKCREKLEPE